VAYIIENIFTEDERKILCDYINIEDERSDIRPDVISKHPRWDTDEWPQDIIARGLAKVFPKGYKVTEVTFQDSKNALKLHSDNASEQGTVGKTVMFLLDAEPVAHTVFFDNYNTSNTGFGETFTKQKWSPYQYKLPNIRGELTYVEDLRTLLSQCKSDPKTVEDFEVTDEFIELIEHTIIKRSTPRTLDRHNINTKETGFTQPGPRVNDYTILTNYDESIVFPKDIHEKYLFDIPYEDLKGLTLDKVIEWKLGGVIVFDRDMLHASSSCHSRKKFTTIFAHSL